MNTPSNRKNVYLGACLAGLGSLVLIENGRAQEEDSRLKLRVEAAEPRANIAEPENEPDAHPPQLKLRVENSDYETDFSADAAKYDRYQEHWEKRDTAAIKSNPGAKIQTDWESWKDAAEAWAASDRFWRISDRYWRNADRRVASDGDVYWRKSDAYWMDSNEFWQQYRTTASIEAEHYGGEAPIGDRTDIVDRRIEFDEGREDERLYYERFQYHREQNPDLTGLDDAEISRDQAWDQWEDARKDWRTFDRIWRMNDRRLRHSDGLLHEGYDHYWKRSNDYWDDSDRFWDTEVRRGGGN